MMPSIIIMWVLSIAQILIYCRLTTVVAAFVPNKLLSLDATVLQRHSPSSSRGRRSTTLPTRLFYGNDNNNNNSNPPPTDDNIVDDPSAILTIPVLGPIPNQGPLLLGAELVLDPPTPWQWQMLQEAVRQHVRYLEHDDDVQNQGTIDAAPLVAVLMDPRDTSSSSVRTGRYATLAAVVGMTTTLGGTATGLQQQQLDLTDTVSFSESLQTVTRQGVAPWESKIRLVGVGRALVKDFFYRIPADAINDDDDDDDDEGHIPKVAKSATVENARYKDGDDNDLDDNEDDEMIDKDRLNLVMAHFVVLTDGTNPPGVVRGRRHAPSTTVRKSPVHALSEMASWARKLEYLHHDRRRLVAGLQAATARLKLAQQQQSSLDAVGFFDNDIWEEDHDGLGMLTASRYDMNLLDGDEEREATQAAVEDILQFSPVTKDEHNDAYSDEGGSPLDAMENYGMGYSSTSFSTIPMVTEVWLEKLEPFYSPELRDTEEYYYEILSFATILAMDKYLTNRQLGWALVCCNTIERMQRAYEWMFQHVRLLEQEAARASTQLRDCGEECTDLW
eukprot:scaffold7149_cov196-Amphora_coffeaeformis.AAC.3